MVVRDRSRVVAGEGAGVHPLAMGLEAILSLLFFGAASMHERGAQTTRTIEQLLARQQALAASYLQVAPLPMKAARVHTLATDGTTILYNPQFVIRAVRRFCDTPDCAAGIVIGMIAHELAHAYLHRGLAGHPHRLELEADWIAGWVLGRAGICPAHFVRVLRELAATAAHPSPGYREGVVSRGYARGSAVRAVG